MPDSASAGPEGQPNAGRPRPRDVAAALVFLLAWLIPVAIVSLRGTSPKTWPTWARDYYSVSCLFDDRPTRISVFYAQVRLSGELGWRDIPDDQLFRLEPFGHRNRFDRYMARFGHGDNDQLAREELGAWLAARWAVDQPDSPPVTAVRFLWGDVHIRDDDPPECRWIKPKRSELRPLRQLGDLVVIETGAPP